MQFMDANCDSTTSAIGPSLIASYFSFMAQTSDNYGETIRIENMQQHHSVTTEAVSV